ncbi:UNVERIFIED_CONTAM: hypothetical protein PYX00_011456 [Menopon gallinae]|uniref:Thioredoxin domain-containing protein n=1 Tax=Menopon gallinae TaxID=328185 RepID=A0AAW2H7N1_9NEOP
MKGTSAWKQLDDADLASDGPLLIYFYDAREGYRCDGCEHFNEAVDTIRAIDVRKVNYFENQEMAMRFFVHYVPHFVVRSQGKTHVISPRDRSELLEIVERQLWKEQAPLKWYLDPCSVPVRCVAKALYTTHLAYDLLHGYVKHVPRQLLYTVYGVIIGYLIFSIKEAVAEIIRVAKAKTEGAWWSTLGWCPPMKRTSTLLAKTFFNLVLASATLCTAKGASIWTKVMAPPLICMNVPLLLYTLFVEKYQYIGRKYKAISALSMVLEFCLIVSFYFASPRWVAVAHVFATVGCNAYFFYERKINGSMTRKLMYYDTGRCIAPYIEGKTLVLYTGELVTIIERQGSTLLVRKFNGNEHWVGAEYIDENCSIQGY